MCVCVNIIWWVSDCAPSCECVSACERVCGVLPCVCVRMCVCMCVSVRVRRVCAYVCVHALRRTKTLVPNRTQRFNTSQNNRRFSVRLTVSTSMRHVKSTFWDGVTETDLGPGQDLDPRWWGPTSTARRGNIFFLTSPLHKKRGTKFLDHPAPGSACGCQCRKVHTYWLPECKVGSNLLHFNHLRIQGRDLEWEVRNLGRGRLHPCPIAHTENVQSRGTRRFRESGAPGPGSAGSTRDLVTLNYLS